MDDINRVYGEYQEDELTGESTGMKYYTPTEPTPKKELHPDFTVERVTRKTSCNACFIVVVS